MIGRTTVTTITMKMSPINRVLMTSGMNIVGLRRIVKLRFVWGVMLWHITLAVEQRVLDEIVTPVLVGMAAEGNPFRGFLYVGLMLTAAGPRVIEFNVRFGDPEAQVILPMLDEPLSALLLAAATGRLTPGRARFATRKYVGVVLASKGYPDAVENGKIITGLADAAQVPDALVFHAGTRAHEGQVVSSGGRVLTVVGRGDTYEQAIAVAYRAAAAIHFDGVQFRKDIGRKSLS